MRRLIGILDHAVAYHIWQKPFAAMKLEPVVCSEAIERAVCVLDLGCGPGTNFRWFSGHDYRGVDLNPRYITSAVRRHGDRFLVRDVNDGLEKPGQFDLILVNSLMHHLDDAGDFA